MNVARKKIGLSKRVHPALPMPIDYGIGGAPSLVVEKKKKGSNHGLRSQPVDHPFRLRSGHNQRMTGFFKSSPASATSVSPGFLAIGRNGISGASPGQSPMPGVLRRRWSSPTASEPQSPPIRQQRMKRLPHHPLPFSTTRPGLHSVSSSSHCWSFSKNHTNSNTHSESHPPGSRSSLGLSASFPRANLNPGTRLLHQDMGKYHE